MQWVSLHNHTDGSALDGACSIDRLIDRAVELKMPAIAITDHGNMIKAYEFYQKCKAKNIKPIIGCEFYMGEQEQKNSYHLLCIAKNNEGLKNLYRLNAYSYKNNFYKKPRITWDKLIEHKKGIIVTTACIGSLWGQTWIKSDKTRVPCQDTLKAFKFYFQDDFYLEIQPNAIPEQHRYNNMLLWASLNLEIPLVATTDVHYVLKEDFKAHDVMLAMQVKKKISDPDRFKFSCNDFYLKSAQEMYDDLNRMELMPDKTYALKHTLFIAEECNVTIEPRTDLLPVFNDLNITRANALLREHLTKKCVKLFDVSRTDVVERVFYELSVIEQKGYAGYFLIVEDIIENAKKKGIYVGPGRGSAAGCMVSYILGITMVDPIKHGLLFERFLNPDRDTSPDIDSDIDYEFRYRVINYIKEHFGENKVAQVIAEGTLAPLATVRRVLSVFDHPQRVITQVAKTLQRTGVKTLTEAYDKYPQFKRYMDNMPEEFDVMLKLEGLMSHESTHAAGIVITPEPVYDIFPCSYDRNTNLYKTQWHKKHIEKLGGYKFDWLGLKTLSVIRKTHEHATAAGKMTSTFLPLEKADNYDHGIYELLNSGRLDGIFQFDKAAGRQALERIKPTCFEDVVAATALCRPGVIEAEKYYMNKAMHDQGKEYKKPSYWEHVKDILEPTYDSIIFQEQAMMLMTTMTGGAWNLGKADSMRKEKNLEPFRQEFIQHCVNNGISHSHADDVFGRFDLGYAFNKSHAVAYSYLSCYCAYLKYYFPKEFYAALMSIENLNTDNDLLSQINEAKSIGIKILPPDVRVSRGDFTPTEEGIRFPLTAIKNVGTKVIEWLENNRDAILPVFYSRTFTLPVFVKNTPKNIFNKRVMTNLIKAGAFDYISPNRCLLLKEYFKIRKEEFQEYTWSNDICMSFEKEVLGMYLSYHPLDNITIPTWQEFKDNEEATTIGIINNIKKIQDKHGKDMAFVSLESKDVVLELVIFSYVYNRIKDLLNLGARIMAKGQKQSDKMIAKTLEVV